MKKLIIAGLLLSKALVASQEELRVNIADRSVLSQQDFDKRSAQKFFKKISDIINQWLEQPGAQGACSNKSTASPAYIAASLIAAEQLILDGMGAEVDILVAYTKFKETFDNVQAKLQRSGGFKHAKAKLHIRRKKNNCFVIHQEHERSRNKHKTVEDALLNYTFKPHKNFKSKCLGGILEDKDSETESDKEISSKAVNNIPNDPQLFREPEHSKAQLQDDFDVTKLEWPDLVR